MVRELNAVVRVCVKLACIVSNNARDFPVLRFWSGVATTMCNGINSTLKSSRKMVLARSVKTTYVIINLIKKCSTTGMMPEERWRSRGMTKIMLGSMQISVIKHPQKSADLMCNVRALRTTCLPKPTSRNKQTQICKSCYEWESFGGRSIGLTQVRLPTLPCWKKWLGTDLLWCKHRYAKTAVWLMALL